MLEKEIQKQILDYLGIKKYFYWRNNTGAMPTMYKGRKGFVRFGDVGSPDIFLVREGRIYGLEVKTPKGKQSDTQIRW